VEAAATQSSLSSVRADPSTLYPSLDWSRSIIVLGIESTAHTFGVGIASSRKPYILANVRRSYQPLKGGIHPREAASHHVSVSAQVLAEALEKAGVGISEINAIAVALGPGLGPALRVGATIARGLAAYYRKPLVAVNHALAHIEVARFYAGFEDPLVLYVSGGNTMVTAYARGRYRVFGETLDIALGNLLDTFAREVGLAPPYVKEGLHAVDHCALRAREPLLLPYTVKGMDVSYSGLLTAALRAWHRVRGMERHSVCLGLREVAYGAAVEVAERGLMHTRKNALLLTGGVAASPVLQEKAGIMAKLHDRRFAAPPPELAGDNGAMIAWLGLLNYLAGLVVEPEEAVVRQRWRLDMVEAPWR